MPEEFDELLEDCGLDELYPEYRHMEAVIPTEPRPPHPGKEELEFLPDSPEVLAQTIEAIGCARTSGLSGKNSSSSLPGWGGRSS